MPIPDNVAFSGTDPLFPLLTAVIAGSGFTAIRQDIDPGEHPLFLNGACAWHLGSTSLGTVAVIVVPMLTDSAHGDAVRWASWDDKALLMLVKRIDPADDRINVWQESWSGSVAELIDHLRPWLKAQIACGAFDEHRRYYAEQRAVAPHERRLNDDLAQLAFRRVLKRR